MDDMVVTCQYLKKRCPEWTALFNFRIDSAFVTHERRSAHDDNADNYNDNRRDAHVPSPPCYAQPDDCRGSLAGLLSIRSPQKANQDLSMCFAKSII